MDDPRFSRRIMPPAGSEALVVMDRKSIGVWHDRNQSVLWEHTRHEWYQFTYTWPSRLKARGRKTNAFSFTIPACVACHSQKNIEFLSYSFPREYLLSYIFKCFSLALSSYIYWTPRLRIPHIAADGSNRIKHWPCRTFPKTYFSFKKPFNIYIPLYIRHI